MAEYAQEVRASKATVPASVAIAAEAEGDAPKPSGTSPVELGPRKQGGVAGFLKMAACCGGMLLLLPALGLVSAGGLAAVAGSALSVAAVLACPLGMYFMMRAMMKQGSHGAHGPDANTDRKALPPEERGPSA